MSYGAHEKIGASIVEVDMRRRVLQIFNMDPQQQESISHFCWDDINGRVFVDDVANHRVLMLNSKLELECVLLSTELEQSGPLPSRLCYIAKINQLVVDQYYAFSVYNLI